MKRLPVGAFFMQKRNRIFDASILIMFRFYKSFKYALNGVILLTRTERNFQIILVCMVLTLITGFGLGYFGQHLTRFEWAILWLTIGLMLVSEGLNTALEKALDTLHPDLHVGVGQSKDIAAGATFCASAVSIIVGLYILLPHIIAAFTL